MSQVTETLAQLLERRLLEMGKSRGRDEKISLREAYMRLPEDRPGVSYETVRRIREEGHTNIGAGTARALATMLGVTVEEVQLAAGQRPTLGRFELPDRADRLNEGERNVVLGVVDAILDAAQPGARGRSGPVPQRHLAAVAQEGREGDAAVVDEQARRLREQQSGDRPKDTAETRRPDPRD